MRALRCHLGRRLAGHDRVDIGRVLFRDRHRSPSPVQFELLPQPPHRVVDRRADVAHPLLIEGDKPDQEQAPLPDLERGGSVRHLLQFDVGQAEFGSFFMSCFRGP